MDTSRIVTAWRGHEQFAHWLVRTLDPTITVELGVDRAFSTIELARYNEGIVIGIDWFQGDAQAGWKDTEEEARKYVIESGFDIIIRKERFEDAVRMYGNGQIDLLHIDGAHDYESVKRDFEMWLPKVRTGGVVIMHDTESFANDVGRFYNEIELPKFKFTHAHGLGVVTKA